MFLSGALFAIIALVRSTACFPFGQTNEAVHLNYRCLHIVKKGVDIRKSPVLLIHGLSQTLANWDDFSQSLALRTGRRVCAVDVRNHGMSPSTEQFDIETITADIAKFLKKQRIRKVNIIGHSIGGKTGVHFSLKNPDKVDSLVVEDMRPNGITERALDGVDTYLNLLQQAIDSVPEGLNKQQAKKYIGNYVNEKLQESGGQAILTDKMIEYFQIYFMNNKWQWKLNMPVLMKAVDQIEEFLTESKGLYEGPTLFIYGTASEFDVGNDERNIMKFFPNAKLIPVEGAGHFIHQNYQEFEEEVVKFLNDI